jgi:type I toxin-antitoxin system toxin SymE
MCGKDMKKRTLKIEIAGDFFRRKTYPKIRLQGHWLASLGFPAGSRVQIIPVANGEITLRAETAFSQPI